MAPRKFYNPLKVQEALDAIKEGCSIREAARRFGIPYGTQGDKIRGKRPIVYKERTALRKEDEEKIVKWILECARRGFGRSKAQVQDTVKKVVQATGQDVSFKDGTSGRRWLDNFLKRHNDVLSKRKPQSLGSERAGVSEANIRNWFVKAEEEISAIDRTLLEDPSRIFNADETGFPLCFQTGTVIAPKHDKFIYQITSDTREQITVLVCGAADGTLLDPLIIFPGSRFRYDPLDGFPTAHFARSPNGWMDSDIFQKWFESIFIPRVAHLPKPVLLLADGHRTHLTINIHKLCAEHSIVMYAFTPHASHIQQPLDQMPLKQLKSSWRKQVQAFQETYHRTVGKPEFSLVFRKAWEEGITPGALKSAFRITGLHPWSPDSVNYSKCRPSTLFDPTPLGQPGPVSNTDGISSTSTAGPLPVLSPSPISSASTPAGPLPVLSPPSISFASTPAGPLPVLSPPSISSATTPAGLSPPPVSPFMSTSVAPLSDMSPPPISSPMPVSPSMPACEDENVRSLGFSSSMTSSSMMPLSQVELNREYLTRLINLSCSLGREKVDRFRGCIEEGRTDSDPDFTT